MSLDALPTELLLQTLQYVGVNYFRADLHRLTINRRWYEVSLEILLESVKLSARSLIQFPPESAVLSNRLKSKLEMLEIHLSEPLREFGISTFDDLSPSSDERYLEAARKLNGHLLSLSAFLSQCRRLHMVSFQTTCGEDRLFSTYASMPRRSYLHFPAMASFLEPKTTQTLTDLFIDLSGTAIVEPGTLKATCHVCPIIAKQLRTLRRLHIYMTTLCCDFLNLEGYTGQLPLRELVIKICSQDSNTSPISWALRCQADQWYYYHMPSLIHAVKVLLRHAPSIQVARIMCYHETRKRIQALDFKLLKFVNLQLDYDVDNFWNSRAAYDHLDP